MLAVRARGNYQLCNTAANYQLLQAPQNDLPRGSHVASRIDRNKVQKNMRKWENPMAFCNFFFF